MESQVLQKEAINHIKRALEYKFSDEEVSSKVAEDALQYMLFDLKKMFLFLNQKNPNSSLLIYSPVLAVFVLQCKI